ncbi:phosphonate ABC transporter, permease protein PhnE [Rhodobacteraceae bacterium NNCM2]|nr:phosphonate ABC transporter, permease protein PhnE [Coraliihabitans acroporae]
MANITEIDARYARMERSKKAYSTVFFVLFVAVLVGGFRQVESLNAGSFWSGLPQLFDFPAAVLSEAWEDRAGLPGLLLKYLPALIETLNIAAVSTLFGGLGALILSLLATRGLALWPRLVPVCRFAMDVMRAVPDIVIALVLIYVLGGGPVPAMIAIAFHTVGALGKLFSEVNENADMKPVEGVVATGGGWLQQMWFGVVTQVAPNYMSYFLLRFEINVRASAILGFVGAGGIGYDLRNTISWGMGQFDDAAAIFALLFFSIVMIDQLSSYLREKLTGHNLLLRA